MASEPRTYGPHVGGDYLPSGPRELDLVTNPFDGTELARVARATDDDLDRAIEAATAAHHRLRALPRHARRDLLARVADRLAAERETLALLIVRDAGKPITQALGEVDRAVMTFSLAADEARRFGGEVVPVDIDPRAAGMTGLVHRFPLGPISAISPFNFPLNLVAHKLAPALAVGSAVVLKPPPQAPLTAFRLAEILTECGAPPGAFNVLHLPLPRAERLATDARFGLLSFTGSARVGWHLKSVAGRKRVVLELGGNAAAVVHEDAGDLDWVAHRLALGAFAYAGQVCIKVQRILVHAPIHDRFVAKLVDAAAQLGVGDPRDPATVVGPMIDGANADRVESWIEEALAAGARPLLRGRRDGTRLGPTLLADVAPGLRVACEEVFGPVAVVSRYDDWDQAIAMVNDSPYGLQAGVFTHDVRRIYDGFARLEVGGVIANDFPTLRLDNYPYGGVKASGLGREGVRYAMEEMSEPRMLVLNLTR
ncbi:MAG TPA: aldehyde dehydrogenase family protein [Gemmatimonadales bacterium]|nr:aldehyde dehydrogenase family protein [Gemmatimonadales bacterium]